MPSLYPCRKKWQPPTFETFGIGNGHNKHPAQQTSKLTDLNEVLLHIGCFFKKCEFLKEVVNFYVHVSVQSDKD